MNDRPSDWKMDYSKCDNVTTLDGTHYSKEPREKARYKELWDMFREGFSNQPERNDGGQYAAFSPNLELIEFKKLYLNK